jgi:hypothetical protein
MTLKKEGGGGAKLCDEIPCFLAENLAISLC